MGGIAIESAIPGMVGSVGNGIAGGKLGSAGNGMLSVGIAIDSVRPGIVGNVGIGIVGGKLGSAGNGIEIDGRENEQALMCPSRRVLPLPFLLPPLPP